METGGSRKDIAVYSIKLSKMSIVLCLQIIKCPIVGI